MDTRKGVGVLLGGGAMRHKHTGQMVHFLGRVDLDAPQEGPREIELPFLAHGITPHPTAPGRAAMFEKHGPGACVIDLDSGELVQTLRCAKGRQFYGHGVFRADGEVLFCTETDVSDGHTGFITVRDTQSFEVMGDFPTHGLAPHDCMFAADGTTLVISNGGSAAGREEHGPSVTFVDVRDGKLLERLEVGVHPSTSPSTTPSINAGHLAMTSRDDVALVSAPRDGLDPQRACGGISLRLAGEGLRTLAEPAEILERLFGETLSVAIHEPSRVVGATTPLGNLVTFWSLDTGALVHKLRVPNPRGIALSCAGDEFIVNFGSPPRAARVDAATLRPVDAPGNQRGYPSLVTGSHIYLDDAASRAANASR